MVSDKKIFFSKQIYRENKPANPPPPPPPRTTPWSHDFDKSWLMTAWTILVEGNQRNIPA